MQPSREEHQTVLGIEDVFRAELNRGFTKIYIRTVALRDDTEISEGKHG